MDSSLQFQTPTLPVRWSAVSILVLMDSSLQYLIPYNLDRSSASFNPCFNGFFSSIAFTAACQRRARRFNPCFNGFFSSIGIDLALQSLYYGFNPCFNGFFSSILMSTCLRHRSIPFQSLF